MVVRKLKKRVLDIPKRAMEKLLQDEKRAMQVANALGKAQRGREAFVQGHDTVLRSLQLAARSDYKAVSKQLSALKRRVRELDGKLSDLIERKRLN
jgi:hypothetical protein